MFGSNSQSLKSVPSQQKLSERLKRHCATEGAKLMYSYMRHQVDSPFDTVVHGELWAYSLDAFRAEAEDLDLTQHTDPILAGRPAFCQKLRKNKMTNLKRTGQVYSYFARAAKSMVAWKHAKGGTRRTAP